MKQTKSGIRMLIAGGVLLSVLSLGSCNKDAQRQPSAQDNVQSNSLTEDEAILAAEPIARWKFDSSFKESQQKLAGVGKNGATYVPTAQAIVGTSAFKSKDSAYVTYASAGTALPNISSGLTVDFWVYATPKTGGAQCLFALPQTGSFWPNMHVLTDG